MGFEQIAQVLEVVGRQLQEVLVEPERAGTSYVGRVGDDRSGVLARAARATMTPNITSTPSASRTDARLRPSRSASSRSGGTRSPETSRPASMSTRSLECRPRRHGSGPGASCVPSTVTRLPRVVSSTQPTPRPKTDPAPRRQNDAHRQMRGSSDQSHSRRDPKNVFHRLDGLNYCSDQ